MKFYLGTHMANWLWSDQPARWPWFVARQRLSDRKHLPRATGPWALDSGGFTELDKHGRWTITPAEYATQVRRFSDEIGFLEWAAPQDWMCEPSKLAATGLTIADHQRLTLENYLDLRHLAPDLPIVPALQGWTRSDYLRHVDAYQRAGIDLAALPLVGVGSVCRRAQFPGMASLFAELSAAGVKLHGFGLKADALTLFGQTLTSADSLAWSYGARQERLGPPLCGIPHRGIACNNCRPWAERWAERVTSRTDGAPIQMVLL